MERQRPTIATIVKPQIADWQATIVSPTHVNLPPVKPLTLGEWAEHINQTGNLTPDDMTENIAESLVEKCLPSKNLSKLKNHLASLATTI